MEQLSSRLKLAEAWSSVESTGPNEAWKYLFQLIYASDLSVVNRVERIVLNTAYSHKRRLFSNGRARDTRRFLRILRRIAERAPSTGHRAPVALSTDNIDNYFFFRAVELLDAHAGAIALEEGDPGDSDTDSDDDDDDETGAYNDDVYKNAERLRWKEDSRLLDNVLAGGAVYTRQYLFDKFTDQGTRAVANADYTTTRGHELVLRPPSTRGPLFVSIDLNPMNVVMSVLCNIVHIPKTDSIHTQHAKYCKYISKHVSITTQRATLGKNATFNTNTMYNEEFKFIRQQSDDIHSFVFDSLNMVYAKHKDDVRVIPSTPTTPTGAPASQADATFVYPPSRLQTIIDMTTDDVANLREKVDMFQEGDHARHWVFDLVEVIPDASQPFVYTVCGVNNTNVHSYIEACQHLMLGQMASTSETLNPSKQLLKMSKQKHRDVIMTCMPGVYNNIANGPLQDAMSFCTAVREMGNFAMACLLVADPHDFTAIRDKLVSLYKCTAGCIQWGYSYTNILHGNHSREPDVSVASFASRQTSKGVTDNLLVKECKDNMRNSYITWYNAYANCLRVCLVLWRDRRNGTAPKILLSNVI